VTVPSEHDATVETLEQYRLRYALFKSDPLLQAIHAAAPWVVTTDDHEVENNYADDVSSTGVTPEHFLRRRAVAYRAFYENTPVRSTVSPSGPDLPLYRRLRYGHLAQFDVLDTRQFRDPFPCGEVIGNCPERLDPRRSILGATQEKWLYDGLRRSDAVWNILAQQVVMARIDRDLGPDELFSNEQWDGFPAARDRLFQAFARHGIQNPVVLTGDIHRSVAANLKADFLDPDSPNVGVELVCTSIASNGDGSDSDSLESIWLGQPHVELYNARRGYVSCRMTPTELTTDFKVLPYVERPGAPISTIARFVTEAGRPGLQPEV
ncbi:MAG TPA: alkaline phosphatase D family protein, partial [Actinopolymorphaceae bacterium]